ncbi:MAG: hypothetical protein D6731_18415 [Planctomycetota bacterium]|nr:MAG: hypothetical protein D6731_18415 [Planctomycetota bacterium]
MHRCFLPCAALLVACGGSRRPPLPPPRPRAAAPGVRLRVANAPLGAQALLLRADPSGSAESVRGQLDRLLGLVALDADGTARFSTEADRPLDVLISAPGRALLRARWRPGLDLALAPEGTCRVSVFGPQGDPEEDALALVLDGDGRVLPVPPELAVSDGRGRLLLTRLPARPLRVLVASADEERFAAAELQVPPGKEASLTLTLAADEALALETLRAVGHPVIEALDAVASEKEAKR